MSAKWIICAKCRSGEWIRYWQFRMGSTIWHDDINEATPFTDEQEANNKMDEVVNAMNTVFTTIVFELYKIQEDTTIDDYDRAMGVI